MEELFVCEFCKLLIFKEGALLMSKKARMLNVIFMSERHILAPRRNNPCFENTSKNQWLTFFQGKTICAKPRTEQALGKNYMS